VVQAVEPLICKGKTLSSTPVPSKLKEQRIGVQPSKPEALNSIPNISKEIKRKRKIKKLNQLKKKKCPYNYSSKLQKIPAVCWLGESP
jgi:hypothetical protein